MTDTIPDMDLVNMTIRVPPDLLRAIDRAGENLDRSRSWMIRTTLQKAFPTDHWHSYRLHQHLGDGTSIFVCTHKDCLAAERRIYKEGGME